MSHTEEFVGLNFENLGRVNEVLRVEDIRRPEQLGSFLIRLADVNCQGPQIALCDIEHEKEELTPTISFRLIDESLFPYAGYEKPSSAKILLGLGETVVFGRKPGNRHDLPVAELSYTSEEHLFFSLLRGSEGELFLHVQDRNSTNGTAIIPRSCPDLISRKSPTERMAGNEPVDEIRPLYSPRTRSRPQAA